jgi:hypothetical protein
MRTNLSWKEHELERVNIDETPAALVVQALPAQPTTTSPAPPTHAAPNTAYTLDQGNFPPTISIAKDV